MLSGIPGSGKSYFAQALAVLLRSVIVSVDPIEDAMIRSGLPMSFETGVAAYEVGATVALAQLRNGLTVIADAVNHLEVGRAVWRRAADDAGVPVRVIEVTCSDADLHRARLQGRRRGLRAYPELSWDDVVLRSADVEPWTCSRLVLDSVSGIDDMVDAAMTYLVI